MNILLTGATGFIGQHLLRALENENYYVTACSRNPRRLGGRFPNTKLLELDFAQMLDPADWLPHLDNIDAVINAVGIIDESKAQSFANVHAHAPAALFRASEKAGVSRVVQISALGAASNKPARYHASKGAADEVLESLSINWFVFKPSIVYGPGAKSMALFRALAAMPVVPLIGDGRQELQPVYIDDLVNAIMLCVRENLPAKQSINAVGPKPVSFASLIEKLGLWLGKAKVLTMAMPVKLVELFAPMRRLLDEPTLNRESIGMLGQGNTADASPFSAHLGYAPKDIDQVLQDTLPTQADRWHARLYFMRPALRFAIALVWLWSGWVSAFVYPSESSYQMLDQVGVLQWMAPAILHGASAIDIALGIALLFCWRLRWVVYSQVAIMLIYSLVITIALPEYWAHPFGLMVKNLPLLVATFILLALEEEKS